MGLNGSWARAGGRFTLGQKLERKTCDQVRGGEGGGMGRGCHLLSADCQGAAFTLWPDILFQVSPLAGLGPRATASDLESPVV